MKYRSRAGVKKMKNMADYARVVPGRGGNDVHKPVRKSLEFLDKDGKIRTMESIEMEVIKFAVLHTPTINAAAKALGIGRSTLYRKLTEAQTCGQDSASTSPHKDSEHHSV